jgi:CheY-like chemotaxis protein
MSKCILVVDDEGPLRRVIQLTLTITSKWEIITASSGLEALDQAVVKQPDAILLDVMMPDVDGIATLAKLKENPATSHIPVILLTAKPNISESLPSSSEMGVAAVFLKPFEPIELGQRIAAVLGWQAN